MMNRIFLYNDIAKEKLRTVLLGIGLLFCLAGCGASDEAVILSIGEENEEEGSLRTELQNADENAEGAIGSSETNGEVQERAGVDMVCVYVCGAVQNPGVVEVPADSRVEDALLAAGGFAENACKDYVNLAAKVTDGEMLYFPDSTEGEELRMSQKQAESGLLDINRAEVSELCTLPGIGEAKAEAIVAYRESNGAFHRIEDIMNVPGIKTQAFEQIKDKITVG